MNGNSNGRFELHYQPQLFGSWELRGVEALLRWTNGKDVLTPPFFLSDLLSAGPSRVTSWVLNELYQDLCGLSSLGFHLPLVSINLSREEVTCPHTIEVLIKQLPRFASFGTVLELELSENILISDLPWIEELFELFRDNRMIQFALDDFGAVGVDLQFLRKAPINTVKIDRTLTPRKDSPMIEQAIVRSMLKLGNEAAINIVVEGIESADQAEWFGGDQTVSLQGFHIGKPMSPSSLVAWFGASQRIVC